jgi:hypothetical protein
MTEPPRRNLTTAYERIWPASLSCLFLAASYSAGREWVFGVNGEAMRAALAQGQDDHGWYARNCQ